MLPTPARCPGNPWVGGTLGGVALLGPGRPLLLDGAAALVRGAPNMNSLIGLGTATSFAVGLASLVVPGLVWDPSFLEEPVMLLAFVLLGRTLEARARSRASGAAGARGGLWWGRLVHSLCC